MKRFRKPLPTITVDELRNPTAGTVDDLARRCRLVARAAKRGDRRALVLMQTIGREFAPAALAHLEMSRAG